RYNWIDIYFSASFVSRKMERIPHRRYLISDIEFAAPDSYQSNLNWSNQRMYELTERVNKNRKNFYERSRRNVFMRIFWMYNSRASEESGQQPITMENMTIREKQIVQTKFVEFLRYLYTDVTEFLNPDIIREFMSGMLYFRMEILPTFTKLLQEAGQELPFSLSFIASVEDTVRDEMYRLFVTEDPRLTTECDGDFVEANDHVWFGRKWRKNMKIIGDVASEYRLED
ncbi:hypothetical protein PFISCL1PPCAC_24198, partial [Pristionchus fissidentatus]